MRVRERRKARSVGLFMGKGRCKKGGSERCGLPFENKGRNMVRGMRR